MEVCDRKNYFHAITIKLKQQRKLIFISALGTLAIERGGDAVWPTAATRKHVVHTNYDTHDRQNIRTRTLAIVYTI